MPPVFEVPDRGELRSGTFNGMILKYTKADQMRRVSIDPPTVALLQKHRGESLRLDCSTWAGARTGETWLSSAQPD